jgi:hypothetical protein
MNRNTLATALAAAALLAAAGIDAAAREPIQGYKKTTHTLRCELSALKIRGAIVVHNTTSQTIPMDATIEIRVKLTKPLPHVETKRIPVREQLRNPKFEIYPGKGALMLYRPDATACWAYVTLAPRVSR